MIADRNSLLLSVVGLLVTALPLCVLGGSDGLFEVFHGDWGTCKRINASLTCYRTRDVHCQTVLDAKPAPWRYCMESGTTRPTSEEECECQQDCVVTKWSEWTPCNSDLVYSTRHRAVVAPQLRNGKPCPALQETKRCETNPATIAQLKRSHTWWLGPWLECVPFQQEKQCGKGLRRRSVECISLRGRIVNKTMCLQEEAYMHLLPPQLAELCEVPCPCKLSVWGAWSDSIPTNCSLANPSLVRHRVRTIHQHPTLGERCEALEQFETLPGEPLCPVYHWETSGWSECTIKDGSASCGVGLRERFIYCIEESIDGSLKHVSSEKCNSSQEPSSLGSCEVQCNQDCVMSEWSSWGQCPNDTCETLYAHRNRTILIDGEGNSCPHIIEYRKCPPIPCASWIPTAWPSVCFPSGGDICGWGHYTRESHCRNPRGEIVDDSLCPAELYPSAIALCYKPCDNDTCVISEWSGWSECSETCDGVVGIQTRSRYLVVNSTGPCVHYDSELIEEQSCAVSTPCDEPLYHLEYSEWSVCHVPTNEVQDGEICQGIQNRTVKCFRNDQQLPQNECPIDFMSFEEQSCSAPCSSECVLSEWTPFSECSESCFQIRTRRLIRFGENCPHLDSNGIDSETISCECSEQYRWVAEDNWSGCHIFPTPLSQLDRRLLCGQGYLNRSIICEDMNGEEIKEGFCNADTKPSSFQTCVEPCSDRCIIIDWSDYSVCSNDDPMVRTRNIVPFFASDDDFLNDCPSLSSVSLSDTQTCPVNDFSHFQRIEVFEFGELLKCYLEPDETCGQGEAYRTYGCVDTLLPTDEREAVHTDFCGSTRGLETVKPCTELCNIDCYSESGWSAWSPCSVSCGIGVKTRRWMITRLPMDEGRPCITSNETTTCEMPACDYFEYDTIRTPPGVCQPLNQTRECGPGEIAMEAICLVNGVPQPNASACEPSLGPRMPSPHSCHVPCPGECVLSQWGAWQWCPDCNSGCYERTRRILRRGLDNCEGVHLREVQSCSASKYAWSAREWTDCTLHYMSRSDQDYCGDGIQRRAIECIVIRSGEVTYDEKCSGLEKPQSSRGCSISCPIDCEVGEFSDWSDCGECTTDLRATRTRERHILVPPENRGRGCPHLIEEQSCPNIGCDEYFVETNTSSLNCSGEASTEVCGSVRHTVLLCRKNTVYVPIDVCIEANLTGKIVHSASLLNLHDVYCHIDCPEIPECLFSNYTDWSECLHMCDWPTTDRDDPLSDNLFQFRTRNLLSHWEGSLERCHEQQLEVRMCTLNSTLSNITINPENNSKCIQFDWRTSEWYLNDTRDVQCHSNGSHVDDFACIASEQPVSMLDAEGDGICNCSLLSSCNGKTTECVCISGFERISSLCLPIEGCLNSPLLETSQQCLPHETCNDVGECVCTKNNCIEPTHPVTPSLTTTVSMATTGTVSEPTNETTSAPTNDILLVILISCVPLLLFIVILLIIIIVTCKCRQHLEKKHRNRPPPVILHQNQQLNNKSDAANKHCDLKDGGVRVQEVAPETTSHPMHHMHNGSASSGFVDEMEHDILRYGQTSFHGYSQTQSDIDEAVFSGVDNPYTPYPLPNDPPSVPYTPTAPHPPYAPYGVDEEDSGPYHGHHHNGNGMRPAGVGQRHTPRHLIPRSVSEEAQLAQLSGRVGVAYDGRVDEGEQQYSQDVPEHLINGANYYPPSPGSQRAHTHSSHSHHHHHHGYNGGRDNRLMTGLDNSLLRAIEQVTAGEGASRSPSVSSVGSRSSVRRSGRRRHHHRGYRDVKIHSPVNGPSNSAQGYYGYYHGALEGEQYQSNTLPRSGSKHSSPNMPPRSPRNNIRNEASPLVNNMTTPPSHYVRSASNEILEARSPHHRHHVPTLDMSHDQHGSGAPVEMPQALPDEEYPMVYCGTNPLTTSPLTSSQRSGDGDYDHIAPSPVPALPLANLKPPTSTLVPPQPMTSSSNSPHSPRSLNSPGQFSDELFSAIQKRAIHSNENASPATVSRATTSNSSPSNAPPPPPRTVSNRRTNNTSSSSRYTTAMLSAYNNGNPPTPPVRGPMTNQAGAPPPPPPPPPIRNS